MDAVEILLLGLVGLSVLFFLILDNLDPPRGASKQSGGGSDAYESVGGGGGEAEEEVAAAEVLDEREEEFIDDDDDDWEGVERSELEKIFGEAMVYVNSSKNNIISINGEDVNLQLYGLQRLALEGPCCESQPMALQLSARSKWNAWHKLGNMSPETAMEKYIQILSEAIPDWNYLRSNFSKGQDIAISEDPSDNIHEVEVER